MDEETLIQLEESVLTGSADTEALEALGEEKVFALKSDPERVHFRDATEIVEPKQLDERTFEFVFSTERPDRVGDILKGSGFVLDDFKTNPVILWAHDGRANPPIGTATRVKKNVPFKGTKALIGEIKFAPEGISPLIDTIVGLVEANVLKATSVGIQFLELKDVRDPKERERLGLGRFGVFSLKHRLKEVSVVSIGMHQEALRKGCDNLLSKGRATKKGVEEFLKTAPISDVDLRESVRELCGGLKFQIPFAFDGLKVQDHDADDLIGDEEKLPVIRFPENFTVPEDRKFLVHENGSWVWKQHLSESSANGADQGFGTIDLGTTTTATVASFEVKEAESELVAELRKQLEHLVKTNIAQASAIEALADALSGMSDKVGSGGVTKDPDADEPDAADAIAQAFSGLAERASSRLDKAIHKHP